MSTTPKGARLVDAAFAIARELRTGNLIAALGLGTSALDDADLDKFTKEPTRRRQLRLNQLRAEIRAGLDLTDEDEGAAGS